MNTDERFRIEPKKNGYFSYQRFLRNGGLLLVRTGKGYQILDSLTFESLMEFGASTDIRVNMAFSANGKIMVTGDASAGDASTLTVWDLQAALRPRKISPEKLIAIQLGELWKELVSIDARVGHRAMVALYRRPDDAIAYLKSRLPAPPDKATFRKLVGELDDADPKTRDAALNAIARMGAGAAGMIRDALKDPPSLEAKGRLEALAGKLKVYDDERVRWSRCAELLERIGTPPARDTLELMRNLHDPEASADAARSLERLTTLAK